MNATMASSTDVDILRYAFSDEELEIAARRPRCPTHIRRRPTTGVANKYWRTHIRRTAVRRVRDASRSSGRCRSGSESPRCVVQVGIVRRLGTLSSPAGADGYSVDHGLARFGSARRALSELTGLNDEARPWLRSRGCCAATTTRSRDLPRLPTLHGVSRSERRSVVRSSATTMSRRGTRSSPTVTL